MNQLLWQEKGKIIAYKSSDSENYDKMINFHLTHKIRASRANFILFPYREQVYIIYMHFLVLRDTMHLDTMKKL